MLTLDSTFPIPKCKLVPNPKCKLVLSNCADLPSARQTETSVRVGVFKNKHLIPYQLANEALEPTQILCFHLSDVQGKPSRDRSGQNRSF